MTILLHLGALMLCAVSCLASATTQPDYVPPLASEAKSVPDMFPEEIKKAKEDAERVRYSVMIGTHDFDSLEKEANEINQQYSEKKISGDEFYNRFYLMVPLISGKLQIPDLIEWTKAKPNSYAAWYVLGRQYLELAMNTRGEKWASETSTEQFEEMDKYGNLARDTLLQSLPLHPKPLPTYRGLIATDNYIHTSKSSKEVSYGEKACLFLQAISIRLYDSICPKPDNSTNKQYTQLDYLKAAIQADPDETIVYSTYFNYNSPRWGGSYEPLDDLVSQAKLSSVMSPKNIAQLEGELLKLRAVDAWVVDQNLTDSAELYIKAFDISPEPEHIEWLYSGASAAKKAHNIDLAFNIYNKIIGTREGEHVAIFYRGIIYMEEKNDAPHYFADQIAAAKLGDMYAQNNIGYFYLTGEKGFPLDLLQAKGWLTLAANQGFQHSKDKLAIVEAKLAEQRINETKGIKLK
jgi:hypothetical protein